MTEALIALVALSLMEIVLGIDNIVFISILSAKLPIAQQSSARRLGLLLALGTRIILLSCIFWLAQLTQPVFTVSAWLPVDSLKSYFTESPKKQHGEATNVSRVEESPGTAPANTEPPNPESSNAGSSPEVLLPPQLDEEAWEEFDGVSWRDLILLAGGLFLIYNSVREIHHEVEGGTEGHDVVKKQITLSSVLFQIAVMDVVFSLDSVITAVGMADQLWVMITAVIMAVGVMILFANQVGNFVDRNPTIRMLALNFLLLIGIMLVAEGVGTPINKGYIYFAMSFSLLVEAFNIRIRSKRSS